MAFLTGLLLFRVASGGTACCGAGGGAGPDFFPKKNRSLLCCDILTTDVKVRISHGTWPIIRDGQPSKPVNECV